LSCGLNVQSNNFVLFTKQLICFETVPGLKNRHLVE